MRRASLSSPVLPVLLSALLALTLLVPAGAAAQDEEDGAHVLVFSATAGFRHDSIEAGVAAVEELGDQHGFTVDATEEADDFTPENLATYDAVVWLSTTGDVLDDEQQAAFEGYIQDGGGFAGIHAASDTHYDWEWYGGLVGAYFESHPPGTQTADVMVYDSVHPSTEMLPSVWERHDEWYDFNLNPRGDVHVLAGLDESSYEDDVDPGPQMGWDHPIAWCQPYDGGRSWYTGGGHTEESFAEEPFLEHMAGGILWAAGVAEGDCSATIWDNFDKETLAQGEDQVGEPMGLAVLPDGRVLHTTRADGPADPRIDPMEPVNGLAHIYLTDPEAGETVEVAEFDVYRFSEYGGQGIALDPDFEDNGWIYFYYTPEVPGITEGEAPRDGDGPEDFEEFEGHNNLSRFQFVDGDEPSIDLDSEQVILEVEQNLGLCCHVGGDIDFDSDGNLYLSTGDNTHFDSSDNYSPIDDRETRNPGFDARRTSGNTNHLAGKLLRITPQEDGSYTVPDDNMFTSGEFDELFPDGTYDEELARPEIYAMGLRNPFRFSVDPVTDLVYLGDYGPDAGEPDPDRGPAGTVTWHVIDEPVNLGWPYCAGNNFAYNVYDFETEESGDPFDCEGGPTNDSRHNTGLEQLPPVTPATIWYHYDEMEEFPQLGEGGGGPMGGPAYHYDAEVAATSDVAWPEYYDGIPLLYEWTRNWIKQIHLDDELNLVDITETVPNLELDQAMDMEFGPDGALYFLEYAGGFFDASPDAALSRITYHGADEAPDPDAPSIEVALDPAEPDGPDGVYASPVTVSLSSDDDEALLEWRLADEEDWASYTAPVVFDEDGSYELEARASNDAGTSEVASVSFTIALDDDPPPTDGTVCERNQGVSFPDAPGSGHAAFIECLATLGIVEGKTDGTFAPRENVSREQLASFVVRAIELATGETLPVGDVSFPDVDANSTHGEAILKLATAGVVRGYEDGSFGPRNAVSRDQTARYVVNALELVLEEPLAASGASFPDVAAGSQYAADVDKLATAEIVQGFEDGTFGPRQPVSRAQMTRFIGNALQVLDDEGAYQGP